MMKKKLFVVGLGFMMTGSVAAKLCLVLSIEGRDADAPIVECDFGENAQAARVDSLCGALNEYAQWQRLSERFSVMAIGKGATILPALGYAIAVLGMDVAHGVQYDCNELLQGHLDRIQRELQPGENVYVFATFAQVRR